MIAVTMFGGPLDGETAIARGINMVSYELLQPPNNCLAGHYREHRWEYLKLDSGRIMAVYAGCTTPDYPCMKGDTHDSYSTDPT